MKKRRAFTLVEVVTVMFILSILFATAAPAIALARRKGRASGCVGNLKAIQGAKEMWAIETLQSSLAVPTWADLAGPDKYLKRQPVCPSEGTYRIRRVRSNVRCSIGGWNGELGAHVLP